jgi:hypothetical protein
MITRADSAQLASLLGSSAGFIFANFDRILASLCALVGLLYTLWKWRREATSRRTNEPWRRRR